MESRTRGIERMGIGIERGSPLAATVDEVLLGLGPKVRDGTALSLSLQFFFYF